MSRSELITLSDPRSPASEAYRALRTNLEFSSLEHPLRSLLVTSPTAQADKSMTLANLAVIMVEGGRRVVLVDADLRRPALHDIFGVGNTSGLSDVIRQSDEISSLPLQESGIEGLKLLTSGPLPQNPSVLLGSVRMDEVIACVTEQADLVLLDAPPVLAVTDAAVLAMRVDGTLLVVRAGRTRREHIRQAKALLAKVNAHLVGAALTNTSLDNRASRYYR